jgi:N-acetylglucosaminyldiphosphoundecaprenol N-acetyl-beta-D-mannosaminyltransferase
MFSLFGITIANISLAEVISKLTEFRRAGGKHMVVTANPEIMLEAKRNPQYQKILKQASLVVPDGFGLILASYLLGQPLTRGRVTGVDLTREIIKNSGEQGYTVFLAGSTIDVLNKTTLYFKSNYKNINIVGKYSALTHPLHADKLLGRQLLVHESEELIRLINYANPDVLLLAFGHPKQEFWLAEHINELSIKIGIGVGGTFDYLSGTVRRAPIIFQVLGLEWLFRLINEPQRWRRIYNAVVVFPLAVFVEFIKQNRSTQKQSNMN